MADFKISVELDANGVATRANAVKATMKGVGDEIESSGRRSRSVADRDMSALATRLQSVAGYAKQAGQAMQMAGVALTASLTAPLVALGTLGVTSALEVDKVRTKITALVGDAATAETKIAELRSLADRSVGLTQKAALEGYAQLKGIGGIADKTINDVVAAMGKLNAAFDVEDLAGFQRNLTQIFTQGFEMTDIKEAIGRVPIFRQLLTQAFGTDDPAKLKELQASGALTLDSFLQGISGAIDSDPRIANIQENLSVKLAKASERLNVALAPVGQVILDTVVPAFEAVVPYIQSLGQWFQSLSPAAKTAAVVIGGIAAAIGPVLIVLGTVVTVIAGVVGGIASAAIAVGGFVALAKIVGIVLLGLVGLFIQLAPVIIAVGVAAVTLYNAWQTNFGGIRDYTIAAWNVIRSTIETALNAIRELTASVVGDIVAWWNDNYPLIEQTVTRVSEAIEGIIATVLGTIASLWQAHGEQIKAILAAAWSVISTVVRTGVSVLLGIVKMAMQIVNGDWAGAWETFTQIVLRAVAGMRSIGPALVTIIVNSIKLVISALVSLGNLITTTVVEIGKNLVLGLARGILTYQTTVISAARSVITSVVNVFRTVPKVESPSRVTTEIGEFMALGLAVGMENQASRVRAAARKLATDTINELRTAAVEFASLAGASEATINQIAQTERVRTAAQQQREIIKLRSEMGMTQQPLPTTIAETERVLRQLEDEKRRRDEFQKVLDDLAKMPAEIAAAMEAAEEALRKGLRDRIENIQRSGAIDVLNLQQEIALIGVADEIDRERIKNYYDLARLREEMMNDGYSDDQIKEARAILAVEQGRRLEMQEILKVRKQIADAAKLGEDMLGDLERLRNGNRELSVYDQTLRRIAQDYRDISPEQQEYLLGLASQIDAQKAYNEEYSRLFEFVRGTFDILAERGKSFGEKMKSIFGGIADRFKKMLLDMAANWLTSRLMGGGGGGGSSASGGGGFGGFLQGLFGGGNRAAGPGGTPMFNPGSGGGILQAIQQGSASSATAGGAGGGGLFSRLFGGFNRAGIASMLPMLGLGIGSSLGGGQGISGILGGAGGLLAGGIGAAFLAPGMFGTGAFATGTLLPFLTNPFTIAAAGALIVGAMILKRNAARRRDEKLRNQGMLDAFEQLKQYDSIISDVRGLRLDPASGIAQGEALGQQTRSSYLQMANSLKDKKTRNIALRDVSRIDAIISQKMAELRAAADIATAAGERSQRMLPEFAKGVFISPAFQAFRRYNGMLAGAWTGRDTLPAMLARGEMVLNPDQQARVRANAGFDAFRNAGIPGYAGGGMAVASSPVVVEAPAAPVNIEITIEQDAQGMFEAFAKSDAGRRVTVNVVNDAFANSQIRSRRRGA